MKTLRVDNVSPAAPRAPRRTRRTATATVDTRGRAPDCYELAARPQLAMLAALDGALALTASTLQAAHPPLRLDRSGWTVPLDQPTDSAARTILNLASLLREAVDQYLVGVDREKRQLTLFAETDPF